MTKIKICGIRTKGEGAAALAAGADALGFVFAPSSRQVTAEKVREIIESLPPFLSTVGVFVNEEREKVLDIARETGLHVLQFHGEESPSYIDFFQKSTSFKVIKTLRIKTIDSFRGLEKYNPAAFLFDTYSPLVYGGSGQPFNWYLLKKIPFNTVPFILAGGLKAENIKQALEITRPYGVDVSSGVEGSKGKDINKIKQFVKEVRRWEVESGRLEVRRGLGGFEF